MRYPGSWFEVYHLQPAYYNRDLPSRLMLSKADFIGYYNNSPLVGKINPICLRSTHCLVSYPSLQLSVYFVAHYIVGGGGFLHLPSYFGRAGWGSVCEMNFLVPQPQMPLCLPGPLALLTFDRQRLAAARSALVITNWHLI